MGLRVDAARVVQSVFAEYKHAEPIVLRRALHAAYPFAARKGHAYRVWLSEVRLECAKARVPWRRTSAPREQLRLLDV